MAEPTNEEKIRQLEEMKEKLSEANEFEAERIKQLEAQEAILEKILKTQEDISNLEDADLAKLVTDLQSKLVSRNAAQQAFVKVSQDSLFNYLR